MTGSFPSTQVPESAARYLSDAEKRRIALDSLDGKTVGETAQALGRDRAGIRRALKRDEVQALVVAEQRRRANSEKNARHYQQRKAAAASPRPSTGGADGKLLGIFATGGPGSVGAWDAGSFHSMADERWTEIRDEKDAAAEALAKEIEQGWPPSGLVPGFRARDPQYPAARRLPYQAERSELAALVAAGWTPDPAYAEVVARYLAESEVAETEAAQAAEAAAYRALPAEERQALQPGEFHRRYRSAQESEAP